MKLMQFWVLESPQQLGYHSENNGPCGRVRFKNESSCGPKIESAIPRTSPPSKAIHFFQLFFTNALLLQIIQWSNQYASEGKVAKSYIKDGGFEERTLEEFKRFLACLLYMGIIKAPDVKNYWAKCFPFRGLWAHKLFPNRDRFRAILAALQVHDYKVANKQDPLNKIRPFFSHMREVCSSLFVPSQNTAVDERMVKSKARFFSCSIFVTSQLSGVSSSGLLLILSVHTH